MSYRQAHRKGIDRWYPFGKYFPRGWQVFGKGLASIKYLLGLAKYLLSTCQVLAKGLRKACERFR